MLNNWIEQALGRRITSVTRCLGIRGGRKYYEITFKDGSTKDYFIDYDNQTVEEV